MLATLFNGGLAVVDLQTWDVVKGWGKNDIAENGCGFAASPRVMNCTSRPGISRRHGYVFDTAGEPQLVATHNLSKLGQDAHGVIVIRPATRCGLRTASAVTSRSIPSGLSARLTPSPTSSILSVRPLI